MRLAASLGLLGLGPTGAVVTLGQLSSWAVVLPGQLSNLGSCLTWAVVYLGSCRLGSCRLGSCRCINSGARTTLLFTLSEFKFNFLDYANIAKKLANTFLDN